MVRKRDKWTRARAKHKRPKTPAPTTGWLLAELVALTGLSASTVRYYALQGLIRPLEFRGTLTRYARRELLRLLAIQRMKSEGKTPLAEIKRRLEAQNEHELLTWLTERPLSPALSAALGLTPTSAQLSPNPAGTAQLSDALLSSAWVETWQRISLLPGLDLMLRSDASGVVRETAQRILHDLRAAAGSH